MFIEKYLLRSNPYHTTTMLTSYPQCAVELLAPSTVSQSILPYREHIRQILMLEESPLEDKLRLCYHLIFTRPLDDFIDNISVTRETRKW